MKEQIGITINGVRYDVEYTKDDFLHCEDECALFNYCEQHWNSCPIETINGEKSNTYFVKAEEKKESTESDINTDLCKSIANLFEYVKPELLDTEDLQDFAYKTIRFGKKVDGAYIDRLTEHLKKKNDAERN